MTGEPHGLRVGAVWLDAPVGLAPMAGYTDAAFRSLCHEFGAAFSFTEVVNARGVVEQSPRTLHLLETLDGEGPVAGHLYGADPAILAEAAHRVERLGRFAWLDLNAGCPVRRIVRRGGGAALVGCPDRLGALVRAMRSAVSLPVTVKTRIGIRRGTLSISETVKACEEAGAAALFLHARCAEAGHGGPPDWEALARAKEAAKIPVVGNGGVQVARDVLRMMESTGVDAVLVGRAALGKPWIFAEIRRLLAGQTERAEAPHLRDLVAEHFRRLLTLKIREHASRRGLKFGPEGGAALALRGHLVAYLRGVPGSARARRQLNTLRSEQDVMQWVTQLLAPRSPHASSGAGGPAESLDANPENS